MFPEIRHWLLKCARAANRPAPTRENCVIKATKLLAISEYETFHLAYRQWYGTDPESVTVEYCFMTYLFEGEIPFWVRHFCSRILQLDEQGSLVVADFVKSNGRLIRREKHVVNSLVA